MILSSTTRAAIATAIGALFDDSTIRLAQNDVNPSPSSVFADFTIANFGGYANVDVADATVYLDDVTGDWVVVLNAIPVFAADGTIASPQTAFAVYVVNTAGTGLLASARIEPPYEFTGPGSGLTLDPIKVRIPVSSIG